ncbi:MAG: pro-sigmaK processing inhibitor BofA family protein [Ruminococcus sp.]|nr:pro-sigmaK processing inhibitor BofA family protein [Ruminococcus sp.]
MLRLFLFFISAFFVLSFLHFLAKKKKPCKRALVSLLCGPIILITLNVLSLYTGVIVSVSELSLMVSSLLGIPGVALLIIMKILMY